MITPKDIMKKNGFTLIELLVVIAIIGILAAVGTPIFQEFIADAKESTAKNSLRSISLIEADYHTENNNYFGTSTGDQTSYINQNLFDGKKTLDEQGDYKYYIQRNNSSSYKAYAVPKNSNSGLSKICIDHNDKISFGNSC
jgi:prepilin-type N-terminal cleavage/methylation domain-containing protein